jgi:hypothetical protein
MRNTYKYNKTEPWTLWFAGKLAKSAGIQANSSGCINKGVCRDNNALNHNQVPARSAETQDY